MSQKTSRRARRTQWLGASPILLLLVLAGCADGGGGAAAPASAPVVTGAAAGFSVRADPRVDPQQQRVEFGADLRAAGIIPVAISISSGSAIPAEIRHTDIVLAVGDRRLRPVGVALVAVRAREGEGVGAAYYAGAALLGLPGGLIAGAAARQTNQRAVEQVRSRFEEIALRDTVIAPGGEASGIVFYMPPAATPSFSEARIEVTLHPVGSVAPVQIDLTASGLAYRRRD
jgi:hypothetical protein